MKGSPLTRSEQAKDNVDVSECGGLYIASGREHVEEAVESARSLRATMPDLSRTLIGTHDPGVGVFDDVKLMDDPEYGFGDTVYYTPDSPYERTLYLDTDTYIHHPVWEVFELLDRFDLAATHGGYGRRRWLGERVGDALEPLPVPDAFSEFNSGVVAYRDTDRTRAFFERWEEIYVQHRERELEEGGDVGDQPALMQAVYETSVRVATLQNGYNCRVPRANYLNTPVKIVHGDVDNPAEIARRLNQREEYLHDGMFIYDFVMVGGDAIVVRGPFRLEKAVAWVRAVLGRAVERLSPGGE